MMRYRLRTLITQFSIRDILFLMAFVGLILAWRNDRSRWDAEKEALIRQRDADVDNERRLADLKAKEMAGRMISYPVPRIAPSSSSWPPGPQKSN